MGKSLQTFNLASELGQSPNWIGFNCRSLECCKSIMQHFVFEFIGILKISPDPYNNPI